MKHQIYKMKMKNGREVVSVNEYLKWNDVRYVGFDLDGNSYVWDDKGELSCDTHCELCHQPLRSIEEREGCALDLSTKGP
jgi:hypothetical protein